MSSKKGIMSESLKYEIANELGVLNTVRNEGLGISAIQKVWRNGFQSD